LLFLGQKVGHFLLRQGLKDCPERFSAAKGNCAKRGKKWSRVCSEVLSAAHTNCRNAFKGLQEIFGRKNFKEFIKERQDGTQIRRSKSKKTGRGCILDFLRFPYHRLK